jgi:hypothetical protein
MPKQDATIHLHLVEEAREFKEDFRMMKQDTNEEANRQSIRSG